MQQCVCLTHGRCGTEYIFSALRKITPCGYEIFNKICFDSKNLGVEFNLGDFWHCNYLNIKTIENYFNAGGHIPKIQFYQIDTKITKQIIEKYKVVLISRRDLFTKNLSALVLEQTKSHIHKNEEYFHPKVHIDCQLFISYYEHSLEHDKQIKELLDPQRTLSLYYEDFSGKLDDTCRQILDFCGHEEKIESFTTDFKKREVDYSQIVTNYNELKELV